MSIFTKVLILFLISLFLMIFVSKKTEMLTQSTLKSLLKEKYIQVSDELFNTLANNNLDSLSKKLKELNYKIIEDKKYYFDSSKIIYNYETKLSTISILEYKDDKFLLYMKYLDDDILVLDISQNKIFKEIEFLNYLILADIFILIILFSLIIKIIYPLKNISKNIKKFGDGDYSSRIQITSNDEIAEVSKTFNSMASNIQELILSRQRFLRDITHELKTPIAKSKLAIEMVESSKYKFILQRALTQMDEMTNEILNLEKLDAKQSTLKIEKFSVETLVSSALSKLFIEEEELINIQIESNFTLEADLNYLLIALKNLIDNALKYSTIKPIYIEVKDKKISVKSQGRRLEKPLKFYCEVFTQGDNSRGETGYGLGLSMVDRILNLHNFKLHYSFKNNYNIFSIKI